MKIAGLDPTTLPVEEVLVLPRGEQQIVFRATGLKDMEGFKKLSPEPVAPVKLTKQGKVADTEDKGYQEVLENYNKRRIAYIVVSSLQPSEIEWDTVELSNPATWTNWETDLKSAGFSDIECSRVLALVLEANCLDETKLRKARELFLRGTPEVPVA
jgi:hypothetical protein